jgi:rhodanese-related sulfurtransferase
MKKLMVSLLTLVSATALALADDAFPNITTDELKQAIADKQVLLVDVNGTESWQDGHIPGALNFEKVEKDFAKVLPADKNALVVAYCGNERCTAYKAAAAAAKKLGYTNVKHYSKGIAGWKKAGEKTEKGT